jgi:hypothetical protein
VLGPDEANLSELSVEELKALKTAILARARERVGPEGFNPVMMDTTGELSTIDWVYDPADRYILVASIIRAMRLVATGIATAGSWMGAATVLSSPNPDRYGVLMIGVGVVFSVVLMIDVAISAVRPVTLNQRTSATRLN